MTLLATERIKLFTTRSPWWCMAIAMAVTVGLAALAAANANPEVPMTINSTQFGYSFGLMVVMVMAALAVTTEYRFSTIRATFQAIPNRTAALLAKTAVVTILAVLIGEVAAFGSVAIADLIAPSADLAINSAGEWRTIAGMGLIYGLAAVIAVSVGIMVRHSAGAISLVLIYSLVVENLILLIPNIGKDIHAWMPFVAAEKFRTGDTTEFTSEFAGALAPWPSLAYFAGFAVVLLIAALVSANKRDA